VVGVAASLALVVMGNYLRDAIEVMVGNQFNQAMRLDVAITS
jgi:putative ABC transport system permease protein